MAESKARCLRKTRFREVKRRNAHTQTDSNRNRENIRSSSLLERSGKSEVTIRCVSQNRSRGENKLEKCFEKNIYLFISSIFWISPRVKTGYQNWHGSGALFNKSKIILRTSYFFRNDKNKKHIFFKVQKYLKSKFL